MDDRAPPRPGATGRAVGRRPVNGRPRSRCRPGSRRYPACLPAAPGDGPKGTFGAAERRQSLGAFASDERFEPGPDHGGLLAKAAQSCGSTEQCIVDVQRRAHMHQYARVMHTRSRHPPRSLGVPPSREDAHRKTPSDSTPIVNSNTSTPLVSRRSWAAFLAIWREASSTYRSVLGGRLRPGMRARRRAAGGLAARAGPLGGLALSSRAVFEQSPT